MCGIMSIDMHDMIYVNNLLKNLATKRLSGKTHRRSGPDDTFDTCVAVLLP